MQPVAFRALPTVFPELVAQLYEATKTGKYGEAFELQEKVNYLREVQHMAQSIPVVHTSLEFRGVDAGYPRHPYSKVPVQIREKMKEEINKLGLLP